jgi:alkylation response protein AidB-like acyl-CoA dehydrogenase
MLAALDSLQLSEAPANPITTPLSPDQCSPAALVALVEQLQQDAPQLDREGAVPAREIARIAALGLLAAPVPHTLGGLGYGTNSGATLGLLALLSEIGRGNLSLGRLYEGHANALQLIATYGTPSQLAAAAADARDGRQLFGVWNTEAADGITFTPTGGGRYRLSGAKTFASGAGVVGRAMVPGRLPEGGWQMCLVPMDQVATQTDASWWRPMGMYGSASFKVDFSGVEIGPEALIGAPDAYQRQPWMSAGAIRFAAVQLGGAQALFDAARTELRSLGRDGDPHQRARFGQMAVAIESGRLWLRGAAPHLDDLLAAGADGTLDDALGQRVVGYVNMARTAIERICLDTIELAQRSVGVRGMLKPHPVERLVRDLTTYLRQPAPDAALTDAGRYVLESSATSPALWPTIWPALGEVAP